MPKDRRIVPGGAALFQSMFTRLGCDGRPPRFRVEFYPYSSLVLTIRRREETVYVRLSDLLRRAPLAVVEGAAALLLSRVYRRKASRELTAPYLEYCRARIAPARASIACASAEFVRAPPVRWADISIWKDCSTN